MPQTFAHKLKGAVGGLRQDLRALFRAESYTLRGRLVALVLSLVLFSLLVPGALLILQHRVNRDATRVTVNANDAMIESVEAREVLRNLNKLALRGKIDQDEISYLRELALNQGGQVGAALIRYADLLSARTPGEPFNQLHVAYTNAGEVLENAIETQKNTVFAVSRAQHERQTGIFRTGIFVLLGAGVLFMLFGYKVTSFVTEPVQSLISFLDRVDLEDGLPGEALVTQSKMPEVSRLSAAFDRFVERIRGYRALNIRRLLIEKHRADLIAKSIFDGIFLLKGDELVYANPIGERILGVNSVNKKRIRLSALLDRAGASAPPVEGGENANLPALRAIQSAVTQTLPVEFSITAEDRVFHYLLQARPVLEPMILGEEEAFAHEMGEISSAEPPVSGSESFRATMLVVAQDVTIVRESQEAKGHFLATLSHEIKTPVTSLTMATRLLKKYVEQIPNPSHRSLIITCAEDVDRLRGLLGDLLSISSFDTLTQRLEVQSVDLGRLIKQSVQSFKPQAKERGIDLVSEVILHQGSPIIVPVDPTKIAWAVSNLLTNGLRHTPRGGTVTIRVEVVDGKAEVRVRDTGPGIDRKRQSQIFEKFTSHYDIRVGRSGTAGVGLAIAREIVIAHQGRIWVASEPGKGAEFGFTLPLGKRMAELGSGDGAGKSGGGSSGSTGMLSKGSTANSVGSGAARRADSSEDASARAPGHVSSHVSRTMKGAQSGAPAGS